MLLAGGCKLNLQVSGKLTIGPDEQNRHARQDIMSASR